MVETSNFFNWIFENSRNNAVIVMNEDGIILNINKAFTTAFGYTEADVSNKYFRFLFTEEDQKAGKPEAELETCKAQGTATDNNYAVHKHGNKIWVTGEALAVRDMNGNMFIVKIVHVIHSQKLLQQYLLESNEFIDAIFTSIQDRGMLIIDSRMKILRFNETFVDLFDLDADAIENRRLTELDVPAVRDEAFLAHIRQLIITGMGPEAKRLNLPLGEGQTGQLLVETKLMEIDSMRKLLLVFSRN